MSSSNPRCEACRVLNRRCTWNCIAARYLGHDVDFINWPLVNRIYNIQTIQSLVNHLSSDDKKLALISLSIEAHERIQNPVYGSVSKLVEKEREIEELRAQVVNLQEQLVNMSLLAFPTSIPEVGETSMRQSSSPAQESELSLQDWNTGVGQNCWEAGTSSQAPGRGQQSDFVDLTGEGETSDPAIATGMSSDINLRGQTDFSENLYPVGMPQNEKFKDVM